MKSPVLQFTRWFLIVVLLGLLFYICDIGGRSIISRLSSPELTPTSIGAIILAVAFSLWLAAIPAIMLYSLFTKRLSGFASCLGMILSLVAFYAAVVLPGELALSELWFKLAWLPDPIKILIGVTLPIGFLLLPFWLLFRLMRLTNEWLYPKILKPLEAKI